ncbi:uncharacterized protein LOC130636503 isoform X2 [Hydractinia symbiolongicarpus]|uniref:uncharacterized protein LOC130636503 isoform X2 n=1 Tax=Hydractinia symbiolongicarpus TaxID=13093 RepID=UPI00254C13C0|nr:uncharacterized protein LOC130636503 isoform X2 [Hydractinia symbiolongicarpus]
MLFFISTLMFICRYGFSVASTCESKFKCKEEKTSAIFAYISMSKLDNTKLNGSILSTHYVESEAKCNKLCAMDDGCFSTNVGPNNVSSLICEILDGDRYTNASSLVNMTGWLHFTAASKCDSNPCNPRYEKCLPHHGNHSYTCVVSDPYYRPLINFTFDENLNCSGCNALAFWRTGTRINVPDRITKVLYLKQLIDVAGLGSNIRAEGCLKDLLSAFPDNCDSDGFVFSFWYKTFKRSWLGSAVVFQTYYNGFDFTLGERFADNTGLWNISFKTENYIYRFNNYNGPDATQWIHFLFKFDIANDLFSVFVNGEHKFDGEKLAREPGDFKKTVIKMAWKGSSTKYYGLFDDILYYNRLLSNEEIRNLHTEQLTH